MAELSQQNKTFGRNLTTSNRPLLLIGTRGNPGPAGADGIGSPVPPVSFTDVSTWTLAHNLGRLPAVVTTDAGGNTIRGSVCYLSNNVVEVRFNTPQTGQLTVI